MREDCNHKNRIKRETNKTILNGVSISYEVLCEDCGVIVGEGQHAFDLKNSCIIDEEHNDFIE